MRHWGKTIKRSVLTITITLLGLVLIQSVYFLKVLLQSQHLEPADLVIVFEGRSNRASTAYALIDSGYARGLIISPASKAKLDKYAQTFHPSRKFETFIENQARTTFENALYTAAIIKRKEPKSVILVTSWDHMPRALLLLNTMLLGSDTRVIAHSIATGKLDRKNWFRSDRGWKMIYNEMLETIGSGIEGARYLISGTRTTETSPMRRLINLLKRHLLL